MNKDVSTEFILDLIRKLGYIPYDISHPNGYFIFDKGEDSVCHFRLKGLGLLGRHWKFAIWINHEYLNDDKYEEYKGADYISIFAQYDHNIDKFKPSRSALCINITTHDWLECNYKEDIEKFLTNTEDWCPMYTLKNMLSMIKRHPILCYNDICGECVGYFNCSPLGEFIHYEFRHYYKLSKCKILTAFWLTYTKLKIKLCQRNKIIDKIEIYNYELKNNGWTTNYDYGVDIHFKNDTTDEQMCKFLNFWWHKDKYGKYDYCKRVIELNYFIDNEEVWFK